jgi:hypothetical protein
LDPALEFHLVRLGESHLTLDVVQIRERFEGPALSPRHEAQRHE